MLEEKDDSFDEEAWVNSIIKQFTEGFVPQPKPRNSLVVKINPRTKNIKIFRFGSKRMI
jgi:hypothetical protein